MTPKRTDASPDLFGISLAQVINLDHPLVRLTSEFDWEGIRREIEPSFCDANGRPGADVRVVVGLFYLKAAFNLSDEQLLARWVENPYWQWFCGFETMQHKPPIDPTTLSRWRSRLGAEKLEVLLKQTIDTAKQKNLLKEKDLSEVNVDTTVEPKAIAFPTDSRLYYKMTRALVRGARKAGIVLRQSYVRVTKACLVKQGRYAHARQMNRSRKHQRKLHTILGRVTRDINRKIGPCSTGKPRTHLEGLLTLSEKLLNQTRTSSSKLYSVHEPHVECIAKGKAHKRYEFGTKVSLVVTNRKSWIVGVQALHGNPFDGHTLNGAIAQSVNLTGVEPKHIMVDKGYRGHKYQGLGLVHMAGRIPKMATRTFRKMLKRRSAIEPTIGHLKSDHRLERNFLRGKSGDRINALMSAVGYNFCKLLRAFACLVFFILRWGWYTSKRQFGSSVYRVWASLLSLLPTQIRLA
jgi:IS5 family transposase